MRIYIKASRCMDEYSGHKYKRVGDKEIIYSRKSDVVYYQGDKAKESYNNLKELILGIVRKGDQYGFKFVVLSPEGSTWRIEKDWRE